MKNFCSFEPKTVFEPFKIKMVEELPLLSKQERELAIQKAHYNLFTLPANAVTFDLLTDSGTSAMSAKQWAGVITGDESYAGSNSYFHFAETIQDLTGMKHVIPTHQGRSAEALLCKAIVKPGMHVVGNTQFDTTRANIESSGAISTDLPCEEVDNSEAEFPFKGNVNLKKLDAYLKEHAKKIPFFIMTVTNNSVGGQPVSLENIRHTKELLLSYKIPLFLDAARFAENAYFIKIRESGYANLTVKQIAQKMFSYADGVMMSAKKDAFANIGGFLSTDNDSLAEQIRQEMVITEGFPTYGGLSGRDLEAVAIGLKEIVDESYLQYRISSVSYFGRGLEAAGLKVVKPFGGHAVYIDAGKSLPHIPQKYYPAQSLSIALYEELGLRGVEVGSVMFGRHDPETGREEYASKELVRLAMPRRVYTQSHVDFMVEAVSQAAKNFSSLPGYKIEYQSKYLRHFTARFSKVEL